MTSDRKHPTAAFWITAALLVVLLGYPLSFGPACSLSFRTSAGGQAIGVIYRPILLLAAHHDESNKLLRRYIHLCGVSNRHEPMMIESGIIFWYSVGPTMRDR